MYDLLIKGASVVDGTGAPAYVGDIAVKDGKIVTKPCGDAAQVIDATGLTLAPGFIDAHSHADYGPGAEARRLCKSSQGITTELAGQCGSSRFPFPPADNAELTELMYQKVGREAVPAYTLSDYLSWLNTQPLTTNLGLYVGHSTLRIAAMGYELRKPTAEELDTMKTMVREAMEHGAMGMSSGLIYAPSCYSDEEELVELCKVVAEYGGTYATHMRNESRGILEAVAESISVAEKAGCKLNISHHKICGKANWGMSKQTLELIHQARQRGVDVTVDVYPYTASCTSLDICLPKPFFSHGPKGLREKLRDPAVRAQIKEEIQQLDSQHYVNCGGWDGILVTIAANTPAAVNKTVQQYADSIGKDAFEAYFDLVCDNPGAQAVYFSMCDEDLFRIVCDDNAVLGTDGLVRTLTDPTHPRGFGSFPRALRVFVREEKLMSLERMVHKMTGLTASRFGLATKGIIADGMDADLVLFDPNTVTDRATYEDSLRVSEGIPYVIVAGQIVCRDGKLTGATPGRFIARN